MEVRFWRGYGPDRTLVELEHRHLERFGPAQDTMREGFESPGGWQSLLDCFTGAA